MINPTTYNISKAHFVGVINALHQQYLKDKAASEAFSQFFNANDAGLYDNTLLINSIFSFLHEFFPKDDDGHCEIQHWCYECNFGKVGDEYKSPEELYDYLMDFKSLENSGLDKHFVLSDEDFKKHNIGNQELLKIKIASEDKSNHSHKVAGGKESAVFPFNENMKILKEGYSPLMQDYTKKDFTSPDETH